MASFLVGAPDLTHDGDHTVLSAPVRAEGAEMRLWFRVQASVRPTLSADPFFATCLIPAMALGKPMEVEGAVSPSLLRAAEPVQDIFHSWFPELTRIPIAAAAAVPKLRQHGRGVGCFFSGGVDSLYTFFKHEQAITTLVYVHGFDVKLGNHGLRKKVADALHAFAAQTGKQVIEVETNLRDLTDPYGEWGERVHGTALGSIALLLDGALERIFVPSTNSFAELFPWGSHPLVDPLWSNETIEIIHDGCEASRFEKVAAIADDDGALSTLRVCWENRDGAYNCGRCEKCLRTMVALETLGALEKCPTFSTPLSLETVRQFKLAGHIANLHWSSNYRAALKHERPEIAGAVKAAIRRYGISKAAADLSGQLRDITPGSEWEGFTPRQRELVFLSLLKGNHRWLTWEIVKEDLKRILGRTRN